MIGPCFLGGSPENLGFDKHGFGPELRGHPNRQERQKEGSHGGIIGRFPGSDSPGCQEFLPAEGLEDQSLMNRNALKGLCRDQGIVVENSLIRDDRTDETVASIKLIL